MSSRKREGGEKPPPGLPREGRKSSVFDRLGVLRELMSVEVGDSAAEAGLEAARVETWKRFGLELAEEHNASAVKAIFSEVRRMSMVDKGVFAQAMWPTDMRAGEGAAEVE